MSEINLPGEITTAAMAHMNQAHQKNLLVYARVLVGAGWAETAVITALDAHGFELLIGDGNGRQETHTILFPQPIQDATQLRTAFILLAEQADPLDGTQRVATAPAA